MITSTILRDFTLQEETFPFPLQFSYSFTSAPPCEKGPFVHGSRLSLTVNTWVKSLSMGFEVVLMYGVPEVERDRSDLRVWSLLVTSL